MSTIRSFLRSRWFSRILAGAVIAGVLSLGSVLEPWGTATGPGRLADDGKLHVIFFDVGQGDAALIRTPTGEDILVDGGPDTSVIQKLGAALPKDDRDIELLILTHPHADHLTGLLEILRRYQVRRLMMTGVVHTTDVYESFLKEVRNRDIDTETPRTGEVVSFGETRLEFFWPLEEWSGRRVSETGPGEGGGLNDTSIVFRLVYGQTEVLFMGDATSEVEEELVVSASSTLVSDLLKVGHHGSKYSTSRVFLAAVDPENALISSGKGNSYGHPAYRVIKLLRDAGVRILRTDTHGDILATSDGGKIDIQTENEVLASESGN